MRDFIVILLLVVSAGLAGYGVRDLRPEPPRVFAPVVDGCW